MYKMGKRSKYGDLEKINYLSTQTQKRNRGLNTSLSIYKATHNKELFLGQIGISE